MNLQSERIPVQVLAHGNDLDLPAHATKDSAGLDLRAAIKESIALKPGERRLFPCGFTLGLPQGFEAQIRPRSGLAYNYGVTVLNAPGTIDADYRGEIKVLLINHGQESFVIEHGMRIAQLIVAPYIRTALHAVDSFDHGTDHLRNADGFGSTGLK